ncbi:hypothetical protein OU995_04495 [Roseateles sp. SL47]|uniref:hypothetical protein n=1 Tax=Roseateles sp. SL47 TaxID=2995138 RepID=UPI00226FD947|nr:hypothetical protein [Roseateles sp. SL47]WAC73997.1 hypothetical protein OU995_04495 [Roseateles sp. SL47]
MRPSPPDRAPFNSRPSDSPARDDRSFAGPLSRRRLLQAGMLAGVPTGSSWMADTSLAQPQPPAAAITATDRQVLRVGPGLRLRTLAAAAAEARPGCTIEVLAGDYRADVATWTQDDLTLRAVGGRVRLLANGAHAQGKGIFVCAGQRMSITGFDFIGARVPDRNGAGIRLERGSLTLRECRFEDNENGLLSANDPAISLDIERCEFGAIAPGEGRTHNCYVGSIGRLRVVGSYFHHGHTGHLLKTRAAVNHLFYNRLTDETGRASFELEFPNGGLALVVGNLIQQSAATENYHLVAYGSEGLVGPRHELHLINNTLVDLRPAGGVYLRMAAGVQKVRLINNLLCGKRELPPGPGWEQHHNYFVDPGALVAPERYDFALRPGSPLLGRAVEPGVVDGQPLRPVAQYRHPCDTAPVPVDGLYSPGALQI